MSLDATAFGVNAAWRTLAGRRKIGQVCALSVIAGISAFHLQRQFTRVIGHDFPIFFHYVNVGPEVREQDMITDVYLPLR